MQMNTFPFIQTVRFLKKQKVWLNMFIVLLLFACLIAAKPEEQKEDTLTWTSLTGHQIVAELVEIEGENLVLKDQDGAKRVVRLPLLIPADQARAKELNEKRKQDTVQTKSASPDRLPVFTEGPGKGYHAVYKHEKFIAKMDSKGTITVQCLENGEPVGKPLGIYYACDYTLRRKYHTRPVISYDKFPAPTMTPKLLEYEATLDGDVECCFRYEFVDNTIQLWSWLVDPHEIEPPTRSRMTIRFESTHKFPVDMYVSEQKKTLEPYTLVVNNDKKGIKRYPYGDATQYIEGPAREMFIDGPLYGNRKVSVFLKSRNKTHITFYIYPKYAPYQGYSAFLRKSDEKSRSDNERMILTIE